MFFAYTETGNGVGPGEDMAVVILASFSIPDGVINFLKPPVTNGERLMSRKSRVVAFAVKRSSEQSSSYWWLGASGR